MYFLNFKNYGWNFITQSWTCLCLIPLLLLFILHKYFSNSSLIFVSNFYFSLSESLIPVLSLLFLNSNFPIDFGYFSCILIFKLLVFLLIYFYFIKKLWFAFTFTPQELKKKCSWSCTLGNPSVFLFWPWAWSIFHEHVTIIWRKLYYLRQHILIYIYKINCACYYSIITSPIHLSQFDL